MLNVLLDQASSEDISYPLPVEVQSALRKTLHAHQTPKRLGNSWLNFIPICKAPENVDAVNELLNGVAHPAMLAELVLQAQVQGKSNEVSGLFDRLIAVDDTGVVGAMARLASKQPSLLNDASEVLFNWSLQHPQQAQLGLFAEYLINQTLPREQRVVAAYGLAGLIGESGCSASLGKVDFIRGRSEHATANYCAPWQLCKVQSNPLLQKPYQRSSRQ